MQLRVVPGKPDTTIVHVYEDDKMVGEYVLDHADPACDRIDVVYAVQTKSGYEIRLTKGEVQEGPAAMFPLAPTIPSNGKVIAQVRLRAGVDAVDEFDIENTHGNVKTGEVPPTELVLHPPQRALPQATPDHVLDPNDEFEARIIEMVRINRRKRHDYAGGANPYQNFDRNAASLGIEGYGPLEDCLSMITRKIGRITNLRGREPQNETVLDSWLDLAVYAALGYGIAVREANEVTDRGGPA